MDTKSVAIKAAADGLSPAPYIKDTLSQSLLLLPQNINAVTQLFSQNMSRAFLHESILYLLRSMSHMVSYEALYTKHQLSWALVTLYYSNYFCVLSMNRLAGSAVSSVNLHHFKITADSKIQSNFYIQKVKVNNHVDVWNANYQLYADFNWQDTSYDGTLIKVTTPDHFERKTREHINYHPDSYKELFKSKSMKDLLSYCGKNYNTSPGATAFLPYFDETEKMIAYLESRAIGRQIIVLTIMNQVKVTLESTSTAYLLQYFRSFSKNIMSKPPFNTKLKLIFQDYIVNLLN